MAKSFEEVFNEIKANISVSSTGKTIKTFSRSDFDKMAKAFVNDVNYTTETVSMKNGKLEKKEVKPVEKFRGMIKAVLKDFGVDAQEAEAIMSDTKEIKSVDGLYELVSELVYRYMEAGKKFDFMPKEDFVGSLSLDSKDEDEKEYRNIKDPDGPGIKVKKKKHKVLNKHSKCPKWLKERMGK